MSGRETSGWIGYRALLAAAFAALALALAASSPSVGAQTGALAEPAAFAHAADCVAALKPAASSLGERLKAGDASVEPELLHLTEAGFAFIGTAYRSGLRKEEADRILEQAEVAQKALPGAAAAELQRACRAEGERLFAASSPLERVLINGAAKKRVQRMLSK